MQQHVGIEVGTEIGSVRYQIDADAAADLHPTLLQLERLGQRPDHPRRAPVGVLPSAGQAHEHGELVAAQPRHRVAVAHHGAQPAGDSAEQRVPEGMAERVIGQFEMVKINKHHGEIQSRRNCRIDTIVQQGAIGEAGQGIMLRQEGKLLLRHLPLRHVLEGTAPAALRARLIGNVEHALLKRHLQPAR